MHIFDFLVKRFWSSITFCGYLRKKLDFGRSFLWGAWRIPSHSQFMCSVFWTCCESLLFVMEFLKLFYINFDTISIFFPYISNINLNILSRFLSLIFFLLKFIIPSYFEGIHSHTTQLKVLHNLISLIWRSLFWVE